MRLWPECLNRSLSRMARAAAAEHVPVSRKGQSAAYASVRPVSTSPKSQSRF
jgi:hypothetical protein